MGGNAAKGRGLKPRHPSQCCPHGAALGTGNVVPSITSPTAVEGPPQPPALLPHGPRQHPALRGVAPGMVPLHPPGTPPAPWGAGTSGTTGMHPASSIPKGVPVSPEVSPCPPFPRPSPCGANLASIGVSPNSPPRAAPAGSPSPSRAAGVPTSGTAGPLGIPVRRLHDRAGSKELRGAASPPSPSAWG